MMVKSSLISSSLLCFQKVMVTTGLDTLSSNSLGDWTTVGRVGPLTHVVQTCPKVEDQGDPSRILLGDMT